MIIKRFLLWSRTAPPAQRAAAVGMLAQAYVSAEIAPDDVWEAETAMTAVLDDASPLVRRALAEALAYAPEAPRHIVLALAGDQSDIAALVLARSPVLTDPDLVDCLALGDDLVQTAVARRREVSIPVAAALAEVGGSEAVLALLDNPGAALAPGSAARILDRFGADAAVREALLARPDLPVELRQAIAAALSHALSAFVAQCGWLSPDRSERATRDAREKTTVALSGAAGEIELQRLVSHLRHTAQLTPALILRALLSRAAPFAAAALAELSGVPFTRVFGLLRDPRGAAFAALCRKAGLPERLQPAFDAALSGLQEHDAEIGQAPPQLSRPMIARALAACAGVRDDENAAMLALLRRYDVEAARDEAREVADLLADEAALASVLSHMPDLIEQELRPDTLLAA